MSLDQAYRLRQIVRTTGCHKASAGVGLPIVVVSGGKGGVGTSTVALNLAAALSRLESRVVLVEADLDRGGSLKQPDEGGSIVECVAGYQTVLDALQPGPDGIWVLPSAWAPEKLTECTAAAQDRLIGELRSLGSHADVLIVDIGSSRNHFVRRFWRAASMVVMVTTPEVSSVMDTYAAIKVLLAGDTSMPVYTLVNSATDESNSMLVHERIRLTCRRFLGLRTSALGDVPTIARTSAVPSLFNPLATSLRDELGLAAPARAAFRLAA